MREPVQPLMSHEEAESMIRAGLAAARSQRVAVAVAVVDTGGNLVAFGRDEGCILAGIDSAIGKAFTSAASGASTRDLSHLVGEGQELYGLAGAVTYPRNLVPLAGGVPVHKEGALVVGVGVGGAPKSEDDHAIAAAAVAALE